MEIKVVSTTSRTVSIEIENEECFTLKNEVLLFINGQEVRKIGTNVHTISGLEPSEEYAIYLIDSLTKVKSNVVSVVTQSEKANVSVMDFGAKGDGKHNDTMAIQASIAACPQYGRIFFPKGIYLTCPIFLKSNITIELEKGAILMGVKERELYPVLPGIIRDGLTSKEIYLASWEGEPAECFASLITGINVENVDIIGEGIIDGNSDFSTWWYEAKKKRIAWRPRTIFLCGCKNVLIEGVTVRNSPSWTIHPLMSENLRFITLNIENPADAPNTDGINPESCKNVLILGVNFSVGDDCIAIKSGKLSASEKFPVPSQDIYVRNCNMQYGHGAVVIGSEMSGGVKNVYIEKCLFSFTDRGIRIKTRRGRGNKGIIDEIRVSKIKMNNVQTPFVINSFYFCDADGKSEYVWSKEKLPVDHRTPYVGNIYLKDIECLNTQVAAGFMYGLPERKIEKVEMENIKVHFHLEAKPGYADMMSFLEPMCRKGFYFNNVNKLVLKNISLENVVGEEIVKLNIEEEY